jgi:chloramphenicol-sensitive protein RarD
MDDPLAAPTPSSADDTRAGFAFALSAYLFWGILPVYMKALAHVPAVEVVAHRVLWSIPVAGAVLLATGRTADLRAALRSPRTLAMVAMPAAIVSINWGIYVWAIGTGRALDAALGYYINPLFSVFLGRVLLGERLSPLKWAAIALAAAAVAVLWIDAGQLPVAAVGLTVTWGFYAYFKRRLPIGPNQGFLLEVLLLSPLALAGIVWFTATGTGHFTASPTDTALLVGTGIVTAVPLILYAYGAKGLRLSTIGMLQYVSPTLILLTALFVFDESFGTARSIAFPMIWGALAIFTLALVREGRRQPGLTKG